MRKQVVSVAEVAAEEVDMSSMMEEPPVVDRGLVAQLMGDARAQGLAFDGECGLLAQLTKLVVESALEGELTVHLGYEKQERAGEDGGGNARNGIRSKTVATKAGSVQIDVPRERAGTFTRRSSRSGSTPSSVTRRYRSPLGLRSRKTTDSPDM